MLNDFFFHATIRLDFCHPNDAGILHRIGINTLTFLQVIKRNKSLRGNTGEIPWYL